MAGSILIPDNQNAAMPGSTKNSSGYSINHSNNVLSAMPASKIKRLSTLRAAKPPISSVLPIKQLQQLPANDANGMQPLPALHLNCAPISALHSTPHAINEQYGEAESLNATHAKTKNIDMLMLGLSQSRRWVFHLYERFHVKASYSNLLQVKLNQQTPVVEWVYKILQAGQCSAILLENNGVCPSNLQTIKALCHSANVVLVLIEARSEKLN